MYNLKYQAIEAFGIDAGKMYAKDVLSYLERTKDGAEIEKAMAKNANK